MVDCLGVTVEYRCNYLTINMFEFLLRQELACFMHPLKVVLQFLSSLIVLNVVHSKNEFKALIRNKCLMLIFPFVIQIFIWIASVEEHGFTNCNDVWVIQASHNVEALDLLHTGIHVLPVPLTAVNSLGLRYLEAVCSVGVYRHKLPCLLYSVHGHFVDSAECAFPKEVLLGFKLIIRCVFENLQPIGSAKVLVLSFEVPLKVLVQDVFCLTHEMLKHVVHKLWIKITEQGVHQPLAVAITPWIIVPLVQQIL